MVKKAENVFKDALALSAAQREELVRLLTMHRDGCGATPENEQAWAEEIERRVAAMDRGEMELIPAEDVFRRLEERFPK
jgi:putative addiction module component (TIGR02574 family)